MSSIKIRYSSITTSHTHDIACVIPHGFWSVKYKEFSCKSFFTRDSKCHNMKCVIYMTRGHGYIQRNPQESLHKPHHDTAAQVTVYVATLYFQFICSRYSDVR